MAVKAIPDGYNSVTPYLIISQPEGAAAAIDFYKKAFGAEELMRMNSPNGGVAHAEIRIGNSPIMLADEYPDMGYRGPKAYGGTPVSLMIYIEDVDTVFQRAIDAGGKPLQPVKDQFYGDRSGTLVDPFGHVWTVSTHVEDLAPEEIQKRADAAMSQAGSA